jgi:site-specific recombinase XerC
MKRIRIVGKGMKVRTVPISNILLAELEDWLEFRAEMAKKKLHVAPEFDSFEAILGKCKWSKCCNIKDFTM